MRQPDLNQRNEEILSVLSHAVPMLRSFAREFDLEYGELYQMAAIAALENYEKARASANPCAYLYGVIRNVIWYKPNVEPTLSLDVPRESGVTYADQLAAPQIASGDTKGLDKKTRALYASLRRLPLEVQEYLVRVHALYAYRPARPKKGRYAWKRPNFSRDPGALSRMAYHALRHDRRLLGVICGTPLTNATDFERDWA